MHGLGMANITTDEDYKTFIDHIRKKVAGGELRPCPVCGSGDWGVTGPEGLVRYDKVENRAVVKNTFPVITAICQNCFYTQLFSWFLIEKEAKENG